jgi:hypothetical protein
MAASSPTTANWQSLTSVGMLILVVVGAFWALAFGPIQERFATVDKRLSDREAADIRFQVSLDQRRQEFPSQKEFEQMERRFGERLDALDREIIRLESTRPTTGELQATARSSESESGKIEERLRLLEVYVRSLNRPDK